MPNHYYHNDRFNSNQGWDKKLRHLQALANKLTKMSRGAMLLFIMKTDIHPKYFPEAKVKCGCGAEFTVGSTQEEIHVEICANCHPFFTGKEKLIDAAGKVEKFKARRAKAAEAKVSKKPRARKELRKAKK